MASPQKENGFTPIANEILDEICQFTFNGSQLRIIMKIWRLTYGYNRKNHDFSITFLHQNTMLSESSVKKEIAFLIKSKVLLVTKKATKTTSRKLSFNKNYEDWNIPKSGDVVSNKIDLLNYVEVQDRVPQDDEVKVQDTVLSQVRDSELLPNLEGYDPTPIKRNKILKKKIFKDNEKLFEKFYSLYPRKVSKEAAKKAWSKLMKEDGIDIDLIINNTINFSDTCKLLETKVRFIPHPSTYLNQKRYIDYVKVDPEGLFSGNKNKQLSQNEKLMQEIKEDLRNEKTGNQTTLPDHQ